MKAVILAGGLGTRISEETMIKPKPMIEIGGIPIIWHIMKMYSYYGVNEFIICCGYKGYVIKEYFANYFKHQSDLTFNMKDNKIISAGLDQLFYWQKKDSIYSAQLICDLFGNHEVIVKTHIKTNRK